MDRMYSSLGSVYALGSFVCAHAMFSAPVPSSSSVNRRREVGGASCVLGLGRAGGAGMSAFIATEVHLNRLFVYHYSTSCRACQLFAHFFFFLRLGIGWCLPAPPKIISDRLSWPQSIMTKPKERQGRPS